MRLRNRITKAEFYTDPELLRWPRDKRDFYRSLWACAEDSACLEDDMFGVKVAAWPSPMDADMTIERFDAWIEELEADGKVVRYESEGKACLYLPHMAKHEKPRNPQSPNIPLPAWISWVESDKKGTSGHYENGTESVASRYQVDTTPPVLSCPDLSGSVLPGTEQSRTEPEELVDTALDESSPRPVPKGAKPTIPAEVVEGADAILSKWAAHKRY